MNRFENRMKYFVYEEGVKPRIYYHYTSLDALYSIVSNRTLWLTSLKSSNDKKELFYSVNDFLRDFEIVCKAEESDSLRKCFEMLKSNINTNIGRFKKECTTKSKPYALCLSDKRDNLTHWDRYAASSSGVCIAINVAALDVLYSRTRNEWFGKHLFSIEKALYTETEIQKFIRRTTVRNLNVLLDITEKEPKNTFIELINKYGYTYIVGICQDVMRFAKNGSFIDEDEVRLYFDRQSISETIALIDGLADYSSAELCTKQKNNFEFLIKELKIEQEKFFINRSGIRGYHNLCLDYIWGPGVIPEIILGPMCVQNRNELLRFLSENGLSGTKVSVSKVPLR